MITLILALELMDRVEGSPAAQTTEVIELLDISIEDLEAEKQRLELLLSNNVVDTSRLPTTDLDSLAKLKKRLNSEISSLNGEIKATQKKVLSRKSQLAALQNSAKSKAVEQKLKDVSDKNLVAQQKLKEIEDNDQTFFRSGITGKTVWLVEVTSGGFKVAQLGETKAPKSLSSNTKFRSWWKGLNKSTNAVYMLTKPSGVESGKFNDALDDLQKSSFPFGFGVISETTKIIDSIKGAGN